jgi:hypothetical protein
MDVGSDREKSGKTPDAEKDKPKPAFEQKHEEVESEDYENCFNHFTQSSDQLLRSRISLVGRIERYDYLAAVKVQLTGCAPSCVLLVLPIIGSGPIHWGRIWYIRPDRRRLVLTMLININ